MKATPNFTGLWYGLDLREGVEFDVPAHLQGKVAAQTDLFSVKKTRKRSSD